MKPAETAIITASRKTTIKPTKTLLALVSSVHLNADCYHYWYPRRSGLLLLFLKFSLIYGPTYAEQSSSSTSEVASLIETDRWKLCSDQRAGIKLLSNQTSGRNLSDDELLRVLKGRLNPSHSEAFPSSDQNCPL